MSFGCHLIVPRTHSYIYLSKYKEWGYIDNEYQAIFF